MTLDGQSEKSRHTTARVILDLIFPWAGTVIFGCQPVGRLGMIVWTVLSMAMAMLTLTGHLNLPQALVVQVIAWIVVQIWILSATLEASRTPCPDTRKEGTGVIRSFSIALVVLVYVVTPAVIIGRTSPSFDIVKVSDASMFPTVLSDETILVLRTNSMPDPGHTVVWRYRDQLRIGRLVATAGDKVSISESRLSVNGIPAVVAAPEAISFDGLSLTQDESRDAASLERIFEALGSGGFLSPAFVRQGVYTAGVELEVPADAVYILADNRSSGDAVDSRLAGAIPAADVIGMPMFVLWSDGTGALNRLDRVGAWIR